MKTIITIVQDNNGRITIPVMDGDVKDIHMILLLAAGNVFDIMHQEATEVNKPKDQELEKGKKGEP